MTSELQAKFLINAMERNTPQWIEDQMENHCQMNIKDRQEVFKAMYKKWPEYKYQVTPTSF